MQAIDVFYQGEGIGEIEHFEAEPDLSFAAVKAILIEKHRLGDDVLIFLEDEDEPVDEARAVGDHAGPRGVKSHVHRCRHIEVEVTYNGETVHHRFGPGTTIARVKRWAAEKEFGLGPDEAAEYVLQLAGSHDRPAPGVHLGALARCPHCRVAFDLVPDHRINGWPGPEATA